MNIVRQIVAVMFAANGQLIVDYEDEFDDFGDSKCSLCQRRFEEQGKRGSTTSPLSKL